MPCWLSPSWRAGAGSRTRPRRWSRCPCPQPCGHGHQGLQGHRHRLSPACKHVLSSQEVYRQYLSLITRILPFRHCGGRLLRICIMYSPQAPPLVPTYRGVDVVEQLGPGVAAVQVGRLGRVHHRPAAHRQERVNLQCTT